jgi:hypothetical protein
MTATEWHRTLFVRALNEGADLGEALLAAEMAVEMQPAPLPKLPVDAYLSHDIYNRRAQSILNRALRAARDLSIAARAELEAAIRLPEPAESAQAMVRFVQNYRVQLASLLGSTQVAALLEGAREVAQHVPVVPPAGASAPLPATLPPDDATALLERLRALPATQREQRIYNLPPDQQQYVRSAIDAQPAPVVVPPVPGADDPGRVQYPIIEEAARELSTKNVMDRAAYDNLDAAARAKAFTVAGVDAEETLTTIRDLLAENVAQGADYEAFREKALATVGAESFLGEPHMENIFRTNIQSAFSDGQMNVLRHPFIKSGFPFSSYHAIHDQRVRHNHLALEKHGIDGSNVYRTDDPVFQTFRPPWDFNDRCSWIPMTVRQAAEEGVAEAQRWLDTGVEPTPPAFVPMPPFSPPAGFVRESVPLSIQLSMQSLEQWGACLGMVGDEWHGPQAPGPDWKQVGVGEKGGKIWKRTGEQQSGEQQQQPETAPAQHDTVVAEYLNKMAAETGLTREQILQSVARLAKPKPQQRPAQQQQPVLSQEGQTAVASVKAYLDGIKTGNVGTELIEHAVQPLAKLPDDQLAAAVQSLGIAGKSRSRKAAIDQVRQVLKNQSEMWIKSSRGANMSLMDVIPEPRIRGIRLRIPRKWCK